MELPTLRIPSKPILLLASDPDIRQQVTQFLEIESYNIRPASQASEACAILENFRPDLILCDIELQGQTSIDFYQQLRSQDRWVTVPFIFLVARSSRAQIQLSRELGVEDIIFKPIDQAEMITVIHSRLLRAAELEIAHIGQAYLETVKVLANAIEGRDAYTRGHVDRVVTYARWFAEALRWPPEQLRTLEFGARLHDIGKVIVPDQILNKPDKLNQDEWELMRAHPLQGAKMLRDISHLKDVIPYILYHHERWDGSGYPEGLKERAIPIEARLLAIVDFFDALTTSRPYHPAKSHQEVFELLEAGAGQQFDPDLVPIFVQVLQQKLAQPFTQI
ncbi:MAG: HD domain-containing protein [Anaerolineales bacterium]|nr:HD domain-containing protein [Anaerolineales bacterium]